MACAERARVRIEAARALLQNLHGPSLEATSELQAQAVIAWLTQHGKELDIEERSALNAQVVQTKFLPKDRDAILAALATGARKINRRGSQDAMHAFEYFSANEWDMLEDCKNQSRLIELILDVVVNRMLCINPCEHTIKLLTSGIIVLANGQNIDAVTLGEKISLKKVVAKRIKAIARKIKAVANYCRAYPWNPNELANSFPALHGRAYLDVDGGTVRSRLDFNLLARLENSYNCRGCYEQQAMQAGRMEQAPSNTNMNPMMMQMMQMMVQLMPRRGEGNADDIAINFGAPGPRGTKRCSTRQHDRTYPHA